MELEKLFSILRKIIYLNSDYSQKREAFSKVLIDFCAIINLTIKEQSAKVYVDIIVALFFIFIILTIWRFFIQIRRRYYQQKINIMLANECERLKRELSNNSFNGRQLHMASITQDIINNLAEVLTNYFYIFKKVSVCIKTFNEDAEKLENSTIYAMQRSENTSKERCDFGGENDPQLIKENSYFHAITYEEKWFFASGRLRFAQRWRDFTRKKLSLILKILSKDVKTLDNSHDKYWKYYRSTIIFPIRMERGNIISKIQNSSNCEPYKLYGFLCVDAKSNQWKWHIRRHQYDPNFMRCICFVKDRWLFYALNAFSNMLYYYCDGIRNSSDAENMDN